MAEPIQTIQAHDDKVWALAWHEAGKLLATASSDKLIKVWGCQQQGGTSDQQEDSVQQFVHRTTLEGAHTRTIRSLAWKPHCQEGSMVLASSSFDATACVWMQEEDQDFEPFQTLEGHENEVKCVAWSPNGNYVATCSRDKSIWVFEEDEGEVCEYACMGVLSGHAQDVKFVKWHPHRDQLFSASYDDTLKAWSYEDSMDEWVCKYTIRGHSSTVWAFDFDPSGTYLASCSEDKTWIVWSISETGYKKLCHVKDTHFRAIYSLSWTATIDKQNGEDKKKHWIATVGSDNQLFVHEIDDGELQGAKESPVQDEAAQLEPLVQTKLIKKIPQAHSSDINAVQFCPSDPYRVATASDDGTVKIWQLEKPGMEQPAIGAAAQAQQEQPMEIN